MRRLIVPLCLLVLLLMPTPLPAQSHGGLIGGPGISRIVAEDGDFQAASESTSSYAVGVQGLVKFQEFIGLAPELLFARRGWDTEGFAFGQEFATEYRISYLELPILLRIAVPIGDVVAPKILAGPHGALFLDGKATGGTTGPFLDASAGTDIDSEDVNDLQFGVTAGVGLDLNFKVVVLTSDVRYVRNFTEVFESDIDDEQTFHESWMFMFGLMF